MFLIGLLIGSVGPIFLIMKGMYKQYTGVKLAAAVLLICFFFISGVTLMTLDGANLKLIDETIIVTNDFEIYGLPIKSERVGLVLRQEYSAFPLSLTRPKPVYTFLDWREGE
jgi:hypothetical protein